MSVTSFNVFCLLRALMIAVAICWTSTATATSEDDDALVQAAMSGDYQAAQALIANGANVNAKDPEGMTALMEASEKWHREIAELLLSKGADVNAKDKHGFTALLRSFKMSGKNNPNGRYQIQLNGKLERYDFVYTGNLDIIKLLLVNGADINAKDTNGRTALIIAAITGDRAITELLLNKGANANDKDKNGNTALMTTVNNGQREMSELLLAKGANVNDQTTSGITALMIAAQKGYREEIELLLRKGADVNAKDTAGRTALMFNIGDNKLDIVELLLANGADVNAKRTDGGTALFFASYQGNADLVKLLLSKGADVNIKDNNGITPLEVATQKGKTDVVELLKKAGAKEIGSASVDSGISTKKDGSYLRKLDRVFIFVKLDPYLKDNFIGNDIFSKRLTEKLSKQGIVVKLGVKIPEDVDDSDKTALETFKPNQVMTITTPSELIDKVQIFGAKGAKRFTLSIILNDIAMQKRIWECSITTRSKELGWMFAETTRVDYLVDKIIKQLDIEGLLPTPAGS